MVSIRMHAFAYCYLVLSSIILSSLRYYGGVKSSSSPSVVCILIEGGAHHLDLRAAHPNDIPSVVSIAFCVDIMSFY